MTSFSIRETCSCGASFDGPPEDVKNWRTDHRHEFAPTSEPDESTGRYNDAIGTHHDAGTTDVVIGFVTPANDGSTTV